MKTYVIGLPCSPSVSLGHSEIPVTEVLISYGGGMGGANQTYYTTLIDKESDEHFFTLTLFDDKKVKINPAFIVSLTPNITLVEHVVDATGHANYRGKTWRCARLGNT